MELVIAMVMIGIIFAAILPQFTLIRNSWDVKQGTAEALQNGRVLMDHINRNLSKAVRITDVSESADTDGYIEFEDNDGNTMRYDIAANSYVEYGEVGSLSDLAGPVSSLTFTCYDACDLDNELAPVTDTNDIRVVKVEAVFINSGSLGRDETFTTWVYLRVNSQAAAVLPAGLEGWWKLDETSGSTAADCSCSGYDGTLVNISSPACWVAGSINGALDFDGYNDYLTLPIGSVIGSLSNCTIATWVDWDGGSAWQRIWDFGTGETVNMFLTARNGSTDTPRFAITTSGWSGEEQTTAPDSLSSGWHHLAVTIDADNHTHTLYIDGVSVAENTSGYLEPDDLGDTTQNWLARSQYGADPYFDGRLDDVRIYDRVLSPEEIVELADTLRYRDFTEAKVNTDDTSITIPTASGAGAVEILGSWVEGTSHTQEAGINRALIFIAHWEDNVAPSLTVTYGGQSMTNIVDVTAGSSSYRNYVAAFILDEAGIAAATSDTFVPVWGNTPSSVSYASVFLSNVDQTDLVGETDSDETTSGTNPIATGSLSTNEGDMVIVAAVCGNNGSYTLNNGFTETTDQSVGSNGLTGVTGHKSATGADETPSATFSGSVNRQAIIGLVINSGGGVEGIEGDLLIAAVATDGSTTISSPSGWTEINQGSYSSNVTLGAWWKIAEASESASYTFTWSGGQQAYGWIIHFAGQDQDDPINAWSADSGTSSTPTSPEVTTIVENCLILRLGAFDDDSITEDDPGLSGHTAITMDKSGSSDIILLQDGFETGLGGWNTDWDQSFWQQHSDTYSAHAGYSQNDLISGDIDTSTYSSFTIDFWYMDDDIDDDDNVYLQFYDGSSYDNRFELGNAWPEDTWQNYNETINNSGADAQYFRSDFRIKFEATSLDYGAYGGDENLWIDDVMVTATGDGAVSGGAGYIRQATAGDSGTSNFSLTASNPARMLTIAIAPDSSDGDLCCDGELRP